LVPLIKQLKEKNDKKNFNLAAQVRGLVFLSAYSLMNSFWQIWNHTFYWDGMKPNGSEPTGEIAQQIEKNWGNFKNFKDEFTATASTLFGSG